MAIEIRTITDDEIDGFRDTLLTTFGDDADRDPDYGRRMAALIDPARRWAAFDRGAVVATAATFDHAIGVPGGGSLDIAGLTAVTVRPSHRRRGILRQLMGLHLDDARRRGVAASGLWCSDAAIYGRFGYGVAAEHDVIEIDDARAVDVAPGRELDALEWIDEARAREVLPDLYARATAARPGILRRSPVWWHERRFLENAMSRAGASRRRHVLARRGDELVGYLVFRQRPRFDADIGAGQVAIVELIGVDARAEATLWRLALSVDLFPRVTWPIAPTDDVLPWIVSDPRRIKRRRSDNLWLRIEDVAAALEARRYAVDGRLRLTVDDATWELTVEGGRGRCVPSAGGADDATGLRLGRAALGALYLGGVPASRLARASLVHGSAEALAAADRVLTSAIAPWCAEIF